MSWGCVLFVIALAPFVSLETIRLSSQKHQLGGKKIYRNPTTRGKTQHPRAVAALERLTRLFKNAAVSHNPGINIKVIDFQLKAKVKPSRTTEVPPGREHERDFIQLY